MSYDELLISALFGIASPTYFINNGDRKNCGRIAFDISTFEPEGIMVGLVGTRFERTSKMESVHMLVSQKESTPEKGYGKLGDRTSVRNFFPQAVFFFLIFFCRHTGGIFNCGQSFMNKETSKTKIITFLRGKSALQSTKQHPRIETTWRPSSLHSRNSGGNP